MAYEACVSGVGRLVALFIPHKPDDARIYSMRELTGMDNDDLKEREVRQVLQHTSKQVSGWNVHVSSPVKAWQCDIAHMARKRIVLWP